jgi:hypothetical protein
MTAGRTVPLRDFFVATPSDSVQTINNQLARGMNLLLTPGVYDVAKSISVKHADTVVLGLGHATLTAVDGAIPLTVADVPGVIVAGVTIDAGLVESPVLLQVGKKNGNSSPKKNDPSNPTTLSDVYFRVGGPHVGKADVALEVNRDNVLIDHTWVWRADHGSGVVRAPGRQPRTTLSAAPGGGAASWPGAGGAWGARLRRCACGPSRSAWSNRHGGAAGSPTRTAGCAPATRRG